MKKQNHAPLQIESISQLHHLLKLPKPLHPLVSVINMSEITCLDPAIKSVTYNFYSFCIKKDFQGRLKYGQNYYDFDHGIMTFFSPGQVISAEVPEDYVCEGIWLVVHTDFLRHYPLSKNIKNYGFFSYAVNEALHVSEKEEDTLVGVLRAIEQEYKHTIDNFSQDVIISQIELLLTYCNRFYNRQFITRKHVNTTLLTQLEEVLQLHFSSGTTSGLPTVKHLAETLGVSAGYLSDMLRSQTGLNAQQHIHNTLIEKAKEILTTTPLTVSEIAYSLGFEYPQSFSKLFKAKANVSPLEYRKQFN